MSQSEQVVLTVMKRSALLRTPADICTGLGPRLPHETCYEAWRTFQSMRGRSDLGLRTLIVLPRAGRHGGLRSCGAMSAAHSSEFKKKQEGGKEV